MNSFSFRGRLSESRVVVGFGAALRDIHVFSAPFHDAGNFCFGKSR
jgi:hypothetical protein